MTARYQHCTYVVLLRAGAESPGRSLQRYLMYMCAFDTQVRLQ